PGIGLAPILDRIGVAGLEGERLLVGRERRVVVAELAVAVADVVPRLGERVVELHRLLEPGKRLPIEVMRLAPGLVLLAGIARLLGAALRLVRLLHVAHAVVVGVVRLLLRRLLARRGHHRRLRSSRSIRSMARASDRWPTSGNGSRRRMMSCGSCSRKEWMWRSSCSRVNTWAQSR